MHFRDFLAMAKSRISTITLGLGKTRSSDANAKRHYIVHRKLGISFRPESSFLFDSLVLLCLAFRQRANIIRHDYRVGHLPSPLTSARPISPHAINKAASGGPPPLRLRLHDELVDHLAGVIREAGVRNQEYM